MSKEVEMEPLLGTTVSMVIEDLLLGSRRVEKTCTWRDQPTTVKGYWVGGLIRVDIQGRGIEERRVN